MTVKGQAAIEYVTTYGWMLVGVALVGGTIYSQFPDPCNFETSGVNTGDVQIADMGITQDNELAISFRSMIAEEIVIDQVKIEGNETVYNNRSVRLYRSSESVELGEAERTQDCEDFKFTVVYDKAVVPNIKQTVNLRLPIDLTAIQFPFLQVEGGEVDSLESNSSFIAAESDICLGGGCPTTGSTDDNREREYVNRSGDEMKGTLRTNSIEWACIGEDCNIDQGSLEGYVNDENNTVDGTLNLTEVKPDQNLCMGRTC